MLAIHDWIRYWRPYLWGVRFPLPDQLAETVAKVFVVEIICRHGVPERIISDRGSPFMTNLF